MNVAPPAPPPGTIIYTSGTTGHPKGVRRAQPTPEQYAFSLQNLALIFGFTTRPPDKIISVMCGPMYHSAPNAYGLVAARIACRSEVHNIERLREADETPPVLSARTMLRECKSCSSLNTAAHWQFSLRSSTKR